MSMSSVQAEDRSAQTSRHDFLEPATWPLGRLAANSPTLIRRALDQPDKRGFLRRLENTYYSNYINLSLAFRAERPDRELRRIARGAVWDYVKNAAVYTAPGTWPGFVLHQPERLQQALAKGKGVVVAAQHLGPQRYLLLHLARHAPKVHAAVTELFIERLEQWFERVERDARGAESAQLARRLVALPVEEPTCALKMVRALKRGEIVAFDVDGNIGVGGEGKTLEAALTLPFLGREIHVRKGVAYLSARTGAPILPLIALWGEDGRPHLHFHQPLERAQGEGKEQFSERALRHLYGLLESTLRQQPQQWEMWPHLFKWITPPERMNGQRDLGQRMAHVERELRRDLDRRPGITLRVQPEEAFVLHIRGRRLMVDRKNFRFFLTSDLSESLLQQLHRGTTLERAVRIKGAARQEGHDASLRELARLRMLDLLQAQPA